MVTAEGNKTSEQTQAGGEAVGHGGGDREGAEEKSQT